MNYNVRGIITIDDGPTPGLDRVERRAINLDKMLRSLGRSLQAAFQVSTTPGLDRARERIDHLTGRARVLGQELQRALTVQTGSLQQAAAAVRGLGRRTTRPRVTGAAAATTDAATSAAVAAGGGLGAAFGWRGLGGVAGVYAAGRGLGVITGIQAQAEDARMAVLSLLTAVDHLSAEAARPIANSIFDQLRRDAAEGAGGLLDYVNTYTTIYSPLRQAGLDQQAIARLTRLAIAAGFATRGEVGINTAGFDVVQALTGQINPRVAPIADIAIKAAGISESAFRSASVAERAAMLERAFGTFTPAADEMARSWSARTATLRDNVEEIARMVTRPVFERWSSALDRVNSWLTENDQLVMRIAEGSGRRLLAVWDAIVANASTYAALVAGTAAVGGGRLLMTKMGGQGGLGGLVGGLPKMPGLATIARAAGPIALVIGLLDLLFRAIERGGHHVRGAAEIWLWIGDGIMSITTALTDLYRTLTGPLVPAMDVMVFTFSAIASVIGVVARAVSSAVLLMSQGIDTLYFALYRGAGYASTDDEVAFMSRTNRRGSTIRRIWTGEASLAEALGGDDGVPVVNNVTNINVDRIEVKAERIDDPTRVADAFEVIARRARTRARSARIGGIFPQVA